MTRYAAGAGEVQVYKEDSTTAAELVRDKKADGKAACLHRFPSNQPVASKRECPCR